VAAHTHVAKGRGRVANGFHLNLCGQCKRGKAGDAAPTFDPKCQGCAEKLHRYNQILACDCWTPMPGTFGPLPMCEKCRSLKALGLRCGDEDLPVHGPQAMRAGQQFSRLSGERQAKYVAKLNKAHKAMRASRTPFPREG
jgi:hypothetical protein